MKITTNNAMLGLKNIVTDGTSPNTKGFLKTAEGIGLSTIKSLSAGAGMSTITFPVDLSLAVGAGYGATTAGDIVSAYVPGYRFKLIALDFVTSTVGAGASATGVANLEIGTTNVTDGTVDVTLAGTDTLGKLIAGAAIAGLNEGTATDSFSIEKATSTVFTAGAGSFVVTIQNMDVADAIAAVADETNALVKKITAAVDTVGNMVWAVPRDFDEGAQDVTLRVLASQLTLSTDNDVELDLEVFHKVPGTALSADLNPTAPGTVLATAEAWVEFDLSTIFASTNINRDDVMTMKIITNGGNDTAGEEVLIHDVQLVYRSTLVSYDKEIVARTMDLR